MWVDVACVDGEQIQGVLANQPDEPSILPALGDIISFERHHIVDIFWQTPETAPISGRPRSYRERRLVDNCVI